MDKLKTFKMVMEKSDSNRVVILTNHYQIIGNVYDCDECNKNLQINLTNVRLCNVNDIFSYLHEFPKKNLEQGLLF